MRINNNIMAMNTHRQYGVNNTNVSKSVEKLSSGYRINRAGDDAAGLAISEKMRAQIRGLSMASKNSQDAISLVQTAEGALQETHNILQRMREIAVQSASDTNETTIDRDALNKELQALIREIDDTANKTKFNDMGIIDGSFQKGSGVITDAEVAAFDGKTASIARVGTAADAALAAATADGSATLGTVAIAGTTITYQGAAVGGVTPAAETATLAEGMSSVTFASGLTIDFGATLGDITDDDTLKAQFASIFGAAADGTLAASALTADLTRGTDFVVQTGANKGDTLAINIDRMDSGSLGVAASSVATRADSQTAIETINNAINQVSSQRADLGALQNRMEHKIANLDTSTENLQAAESRIRDLDMAKEMTEFTKNNILSQAATAMLAQANALPQGVLQLLG